MKFKVGLLLILLLLTAVSFVAAEDSVWANWDGRINVIAHFGGDALYCDASEGCWYLNSAGEQLWNIPQDAIDAAMNTACESGTSESIEVGAGSYGINYLLIHCYQGYAPMLTLTGFDEWGNQNSMDFQPDYQPVGPATEISPDSDGDGIPDDEDACPELGDEGLGLLPNGCPIRHA